MRKIHTGSWGRCPCCNKVSFAKRASVSGPVKATAWSPSQELLTEMMRRLVAGATEETIRRKVRNKETGIKTWESFPSIQIQCESCVSGKSGLHAKVFFVDLGQGRIAGPYCSRDLFYFLNNHASDDRSLQDFPIYQVTVSDWLQEYLRRRKKLESETGKPVAPPLPEPVGILASVSIEPEEEEELQVF